MTFQFTVSGHAGPDYPQRNDAEAKESYRREHLAVEAAMAAAVAVLQLHGLNVTSAFGSAMCGAVDVAVVVTPSPHRAPAVEP